MTIYFTALVRHDQLDNFNGCLAGLPGGQYQPALQLSGKSTVYLYYLTGTTDIMELLQSTGIRCAESVYPALPSA